MSVLLSWLELEGIALPIFRSQSIATVDGVGGADAAAVAFAAGVSNAEASGVLGLTMHSFGTSTAEAIGQSEINNIIDVWLPNLPEAETWTDATIEIEFWIPAQIEAETWTAAQGTQ